MSRLQRISLVLVLVWLGALTLRLAFTARLGHDDIEHLHTAWLMLQGQQPFIDFFQKQSPLLWWLLLPLVSLAEGDLAIAVFLGRSLMALALAASVVAIWLLAREALRRKSMAPAALLLLGASPAVLYNLLVIRPDGLMVPLILWGLLSSLRGLRRGQMSLLILSGFLFGLASVVLLKAAPVAVAAGCTLGYIGWHQDSGRWKGVIRNVGIFALGGLAAVLPFVGLLAASGLLGPFVFFNVTFNAAVYSQPWPGDVSWWTRFSSVLVNELRQEPWLLLSAIGSNLLWLRLLPALRQRANRARLLLLVALFWAGVILLAANRLPFYSYFLLPLLTGAVLGPVLWSRLAGGLARHRVVWVSPRRKRSLSPASAIAFCLITAMLILGTHWHNRFTTNEGQLDKLTALPRVEAVHKMPNHPVFALDSHRIWDNVERYRFALRTLAAEGRLPDWVRDTYESEYLD